MQAQHTLARVGERCIIDGAYTESWKYGTIAGHVVLPAETKPGEPTLAYVVRLDSGFRDPDGETYVSAIVIAADAPELRLGEE